MCARAERRPCIYCRSLLASINTSKSERYEHSYEYMNKGKAEQSVSRKSRTHSTRHATHKELSSGRCPTNEQSTGAAFDKHSERVERQSKECWQTGAEHLVD